MKTSTQHPPCLSGTSQEGNLSVSQTPFIASPEALELKGIVDEIQEKVAGAVEEMERRKEEFLENERKIVEENQRKIEEIAVACEESEDEHLIPLAKIIRETGDINEKDFRGEMILTYAAYGGHLQILKLILAHPKILVNERGQNGNNALMNATYGGLSYGGHPKILKLLLKHPEIQVNEKNSIGYTALMWWVFYDGHPKILKLLLADPRLDLKAHDQGKIALQKAKTPEIKALIEANMREQGIVF